MVYVENFDYLKNLIEDSALSCEELVFSKTGDGRLDSAESESIIIDHLKGLFQNDSKFQLQIGLPRMWYDVALSAEDEFYPINIKITSGKGSDNVSSKEGMFYALTGIHPATQKGLSRWESFNTALINNLTDSKADYYFIVYFKDSGSFLFTSLKRIAKLTPNGNNLPFQCKWSDNLEYTNRTPEDQRLYILNTYIDSFIKKSTGLDILLKWRES